MSATKRFGHATEAEITEKRQKMQSDNTRKANKRAANTFREYLEEKGQPTEVETFNEVRLNQCLSHFYLDARKPDGEHYKISSLNNFRYSLSRYLKSPPFEKPFDIIKGPQFADANLNFKAAAAELKSLGLGSVNHYPAMTDDDRKKVYTSPYLSPNTPFGLFNKVQFDIRLYFFRRGVENMHTMKKNTFEICAHADTGLRCVRKKIDELTKNHRAEDRKSFSGMMPEAPGNPYCPVSSFQKYISKLHPSCDRLWQRPHDSFLDDEETWYCNSPVGEKQLAKFMQRLSQACKLSQHYTNHSIRATGATILSRNNYGAAQIMAVTDHKSLMSLAVYQRISDGEKINMGRSLTATLTKDTSHPVSAALGAPQPVVAAPVISAPQYLEASPVSDVDRFLGPGFDISQLFDEFEAPSTSNNSVTSVRPSNDMMPCFYGCKIGSVNIVVKK